MGRRLQVGHGTSTSSQVQAVPVWNAPIDRRKLAQAILALVLAEAERTKKRPSGSETTPEAGHE